MLEETKKTSTTKRK